MSIRIAALTSKKESLVERVIKYVRSWTFIQIQLIFVFLWVMINCYCPLLTFDSNLKILLIILLTEVCCLFSLFLMFHHEQLIKDRKITYTDFIIDCQIRNDIKELKSLLESLKHK